MGYPARDQRPRAVYGVSCCGVDGADIVRTEDDVAFFHELVAFVAARFRWRVHEIVLGATRYDLVVEIRDANLAHGMQYLNSVYARAFNRRHGRFGHLFARRYESRLLGRGGWGAGLARRLRRYFPRLRGRVTSRPRPLWPVSTKRPLTSYASDRRRV
jgi:putative transposase